MRRSFLNILFVAISIVTFNCSSLFATTLEDNFSINEEGKKIYLNGVGMNHNTITAFSAGNVKLEKEKAACSNCHRRSGYGSSEGGLLIPSITGKSLFNSREFKYKELKRKSSRPITRKSYNKTSLINAIKFGIDPNGRKLNPLMPRYSMNENDMDALISYLSNLSTKPAPGVNNETIHFATIITPDISGKQKSAMLAVLNTYINAKNAETRLEKRRATNAPWHKKWSYSAYRKWKLDVWELTGEIESWSKQLNIFYKKQPVFSIISGISSSSWQPMHDFCNTHEIPCLFPNTMMPGESKNKKTSTENSYSIYFSEGISLEAKVIAKHIYKEKNAKRCNNIVQITDDTKKIKIAANALINQLLNYKVKFQVSNIVVNSDLFKTFKADVTSTCLVHWVDNLLLQNNMINFQNIKQVYVTQNAKKLAEVKPEKFNSPVYYSTPFALEKNKDRHLKRIRIWAKMNKISPYIEDISANTYYAVTLAAKGIKHIRTHFSRDYFVERLEHMIDNMAFHSIYNRFSLGPGQRFASKGAYIIGPIKKPMDINNPVNSEWIIP